MVSAGSSPPPADPDVPVSVIIPVRNGGRTLAHCLEAIRASRDVANFEVIVVDDGSTDSTGDIARQFGCRVIRQETSRGPAAARNLGAAEARSGRLLFIDADVYIKPDVISRLMRALDEHAAAFGTYDPDPFERNFATLLYHTLSCRSLEHTSERTRVFYSYCAAIHRDIFLGLGGFNTDFRNPTFEDVELGCRLADLGHYSAHLRDVKVVHAARYELGSLVRAYFRKSRDLARLLLSRGSLSFGDEGWTNRKNWLILGCAWGITLLAPLAIWGGGWWALPWATCLAGFLVASMGVAWTMARRRWSYGPATVLGYLGINYVATLAMFAAGLDVIGQRLRGRASTAVAGSVQR